VINFSSQYDAHRYVYFFLCNWCILGLRLGIWCIFHTVSFVSIFSFHY
jgi:hypothetical protein